MPGRSTPASSSGYPVLLGLWIGLVGSYLFWRRHWSNRYELQGSRLVASGRTTGEVDLAEVVHPEVIQERDDPEVPQRKLYLSVRDRRGCLILEVGDNMALLQFSPRSLRRVAEYLETAPSESAHQVAAWLRDYAEWPSYASWPQIVS